MYNEITLGYVECSEEEYKNLIKAIHFDDDQMDILTRNSINTSTGKRRHIIEFGHEATAEYKKVIKQIGLAYAELSKYIASSKEIDVDDFELRPLRECLDAVDTIDSHKIIIGTDPLMAY